MEALLATQIKSASLFTITQFLCALPLTGVNLARYWTRQGHVRVYFSQEERIPHECHLDIFSGPEGGPVKIFNIWIDIYIAID